MDFVILKVNGQDVSNSSHEEAVKCFQSAQEPIIVEVLRRYPLTTSSTLSALSTSQATAASSTGSIASAMTTTTTTASTTTTTTSAAMTSLTSAAAVAATSSISKSESELQQHEQYNGGANTFTLLVSTGVQTDWAGLVDEDDFGPVTLHADEQANDSFDDILAHEMDFEEVTLRKAGSAEKLGLTVCYSSCSGSEDADTEVYISEIVPESLAARDGRLREGDQILRVNGKDVSNKEQTENLFAETKNSVTILVSRCLYPDDEYDDRRLFNEGSSAVVTPETIPDYQNSMIEQLVRQQQERDEEVPARDKDEGDSACEVQAPPIPCHATAPPPPAFSDPSSTCSSHSSSQKSHGTGESEQQQQHQQQRRPWIQETVSECTRRVDGLSIGSKISGTLHSQKHQPTVKLAEAYSSHLWSDTEHIYETIPETDCEPIYSSPYEHYWLHQQSANNNHLQNNVTVIQTNNTGKPWHSSSKSNSSGEEKDSSSAYNTGESCNSNTLTLELQQPSEHHRSTLVLCPPRATSTPTATSTPKLLCNCPVPLTPHTKTLKMQNSRRISQQSQQQQQQQQSQLQPPHQDQQQQQQSTVVAAETMYTNMANLQQTMRLQQQLFKQALNRRKAGISRDLCYYTRRTRAQSNFQAPSLSQYQFVASHQVCNPTATVNSQSSIQQQSRIQERSDAVQMEWKVKRRPDGTRYIARRPVRNRILRNRALKISEERQGHTTEDDAMSEIKIGRYWSKEERKKQLERSKERKQRQQDLMQQEQMQQTTDQPICEFVEECKSKKISNAVEPNYKKSTKKKPLTENFATVQEMLVHGNKVGNNTQNTGKLIGLLSVTTV